MEIGAKTIAAGVGLFFLGGLSVYLLTAKTDGPVQPGAQHQPVVMQGTLPQTRTRQTIIENAAPEVLENSDAGSATSTVSDELTHDVFLAQAEARREQQLIDKAEIERLEKLKTVKERSVECKFWKQQQKTSSAVSKIEEKIIQYCTLQKSNSSTIATSS